MPRKSIGERAMTDTERLARYRAARSTGARQSARIVPPIIAAVPGVGTMPSAS
jgi:hypothetical protein